jgi:hypothetical protein
MQSVYAINDDLGCSEPRDKSQCIESEQGGAMGASSIECASLVAGSYVAVVTGSNDGDQGHFKLEIRVEPMRKCHTNTYMQHSTLKNSNNINRYKTK